LAHDDVYQQFTYVGHAIQPSIPSALVLADDVSPRGSTRLFNRITLSRQLHTPSLPIVHVPVGYC